MHVSYLLCQRLAKSYDVAKVFGKLVYQVSCPNVCVSAG
jgi:hypothetical protein